MTETQQNYIYKEEDYEKLKEQISIDSILGKKLLEKHNGDIMNTVLDFYEQDYQSTVSQINYDNQEIVDNLDNEKASMESKIPMLQQILDEKDKIFNTKVDPDKTLDYKGTREYFYVAFTPKNKIYKKERFFGRNADFLRKIAKPFLETVENNENTENTENNTSSETVENNTSSETVDNNTSSEMVENNTSSETVENNTSSETVENNTSSETVENNELIKSNESEVIEKKRSIKLVIKLLGGKGASMLKKWKFTHGVMIYRYVNSDTDLEVNELATKIYQKSFKSEDKIYGNVLIVDKWE